MNQVENPLHAKFYADRAVQERARVRSCRQLARDTYLVRLACPQVAGAILPGQFVMVRAPERASPLLGRAFALYDAHADGGLDIVFHVIGKMTSLLAGVREGDVIEVWGPLGNGFSPDPVDHLVLVAGGIGQTPFLALAKQALGQQAYGGDTVVPPFAQSVTLCYGARSAEYLAGVEDFRATGIDVRIATDDGSEGHAGLVTEVLAKVLDESDGARTRIECCGPEPMMEAVAGLAAARETTCRVSLETPMACGLGICFSCVTRVQLDDGSWDYKRTCVDGPVFPAETIVW